MARKRKAPPPKRRWQPLQRAVARPPTPEKVAAFRAAAVRMGTDPDEAERLVREPKEVWMNDRYTVAVQRHGDDGWIEHLSVKRNDRRPEIGWRDLQRIKSEIAGDEIEAFELYPAESRLVDTANQRWVWCLPPGEQIPVGFNQGRHVSGPAEAAELGAKQAPLEEGS